ncbi:MAG: ATP-dependent Clp protease ATP-binding subunit, partial [Betaproteobacteria bacterium]
MSVPVPRWLGDLERLLPILSQFVLSGNVRDLAILEAAGKPVLVPLVRALWDRLGARGYRFALVNDMVEGGRVSPDQYSLRAEAAQWLQLPRGDGAAPMGLEALAQLAARVAA